MDAATGDLAFLPLGGTGEIGMNLNLYRCGGKWLAVDCGIGFGGSDMPEVEIMVPDPAFLAERRDRLVGLVITHAHEDHIGAVADLWPRLGCPVYATPFAASLLETKRLGEPGAPKVPLHTVPQGGRIEVELVCPGEGAVLSVSDSGIGLRRDALERVFDLFFQEEGGSASRQGGCLLSRPTRARSTKRRASTPATWRRSTRRWASTGNT